MTKKQLVVTGYKKSSVKKAINIISTFAQKYDVKVGDKPVHHFSLVKYQPVLHGANISDLTIYSVYIIGNLKNIKKLMNINTPKGVIIELLPVK